MGTTGADALLGRDRELGELEELLAGGARLVSILGAPGIGKTALARALAARRGGAALLVELRGVTSGDELAGRLRHAACASAATTTPALVRELTHQGLELLVLDEAEGALGPTEELLSEVLASPGPAVVVTSRARLHLAAEVCFDLPVLPLGAATALFERLARRASPTRAHRPEDVEALVQRLDRLPLALELAAASTRTLSATQLLALLDDRFRLLRRRPSVDDRHASLEEAIRCSLDALPGPDRRALAGLSAFVGAFGIEDASAVLGVDAVEAAGRLQRLLDASVVHHAPDGEGGAAQFGLLESIRALVWRELPRDEAAAVELAHARHVLALGELLARESAGPDGVEALAALGRVAPEIDAAAARTRGLDATLAAKLSLTLTPLALARGPLDAHERRLSAGLDALGALGDEATSTRAALWLERGTARFLRSNVECAVEDLGRAWEAGTALGDAVLADRARTTMMLASQWRGGEVQPVVTSGDVRRAPFASFAAGVLALHRGDVEAAIDEANQGLAEARLREDRLQEARLLALRGLLHDERGEWSSARALLERAFASFEQNGDRHFDAIARLWAANLTLDEGDAARAVVAMQAAAGTFSEQGMVLFEASANGYASLALAVDGRFEASLAASDLALPPLRALQDVYRTTNFLAGRAAALAALGRDGEAREALAEATRTSAGAPNPNLGVVVALAGRACALAGAAGAHAEVDAALRALASGRLATSSDVRFALSIARRVVGLAPAAAAAGPTLWVGAGGAQVRVDDLLVELHRRKPLARVIHHLAMRHREAPGTAVSTTELVAAGWPGERVLALAGAQRVWVAVATLRKMGLREVIVRTDAGYRLASTVQLEVEPHAAAGGLR